MSVIKEAAVDVALRWGRGTVIALGVLAGTFIGSYASDYHLSTPSPPAAQISSVGRALEENPDCVRSNIDRAEVNGMVVSGDKTGRTGARRIEWRGAETDDLLEDESRKTGNPVYVFAYCRRAQS